MIKIFQRNYPLIKRTFSTTEDTYMCQCLKERTLLRISGNDASVYLQGLITNDMKHLQEGASSMFAMFLNNKGRVLYDTIVYNSKEDNTFLIECDGTISSLLKDHLIRYKVRRKLNVENLKDELNLWTVVNSKNFSEPGKTSDYKNLLDIIKRFPNLIATIDPRLSSLGVRIITPKNFDFDNEIKKETSLALEKHDFYKSLRYKLGIGEGIEELPMEKCIPMEANGDYLHGISFHKGCYIGQELTARTYHTGVIRKRLMPLVFNEELNVSENGIPIFAVPEQNKLIGKLQGIEKHNGVGLLRIEEALKAKELMVSNIKCKTHRPFWWPNEAPKERMNVAS